MSNVWKTCFDCNFAVVQYGSSIRTELSLLNNEDRAGSLQKVKQIKQIYNLTKTASAINHVLTDIFIPENGSKNNSAKIIIVLSDGKILGDNMTLDEVLNKPQMQNVTRYSIGVGDGILKSPNAIKEMMQIADPGKYYVSSYGALNDIVSSLERGIIGTEDPGTEIAFVLDGSGSIQYDDFQKAKDFIYNVMSNVWKTCFDCNFAVVQYGISIRTELSLLNNEDRAGSLQKVKQIKQIYNLTKTASAINHVLTDIFIPENGSKNNSAKIIIVLSDGEILGDNMTLDEVLNKPQMQGITRYSIGVGDGILKKPNAIKEMMQIADPGKYYSVSSYGALNDVVSSLERGIIGTEGDSATTKVPQIN
ncbi:integrin alpha-E [Danio aesculapii]|uniref:integrin alpha-E n=1 Tax=Danio aesculapii TaxID=1142201 RepID=UPI0024C09925|nr:integrin alpha-E [Danio aesculapii]